MKKKIKVVHVMPQIGIGGAETQLYALIINSDSQVVTHEVLYFSDSHDDEGFKLYTEAGIKYTRVPRNKKRPIKFLRDLAAAIKVRKPDIVHCWLYSGNVWGRWAAILAGAEHIIVAYRSSSVGYAKTVKFLEQFTKNRVHYIANSRACADLVARQIGVDPKRFSVIYNGFDFEKFNCDPVDLHKECSISSNYKIAIMVGRLTYAKNYPMLLKMARQYKSNHDPVAFVVVGHGEKEPELKELAQQLQLDGIIYFLGLRHDIPALLQGADIFCYTSFYEGFPNALLEAMAAGLPIVSTNFAGVDELVENGVNGTIIPINDVNAAVAALKSYLDNPSKTQSIASAARASVEQRFPMQVMVNKTLQLYHNIISGNNDAGI